MEMREEIGGSESFVAPGWVSCEWGEASAEEGGVDPRESGERESPEEEVDGATGW